MRLIKWLVGIVVTLAVLLALVPIGARFYALHWLHERGYTASIKTIGLNVLTGKLTVAGLDIHASEQQGVRLDVLEGNLKLESLSNKAIVFQKLKLQGLRIDLGQLDTKVDTLVTPIERFVNQHMPEWRFDIVNSLAEHSEICRTGLTPAGKALSQCFSVGSASLHDATVQNTANGWQFATRSSAQLQRMYFKDHFNGTSLMYIGDAQIRDIVADKRERRIGQIALTSFHLVERSEAETERLSTPYQTQLDNLLVNDIVETRSDERLNIQLGLVDITALRQTLHKDRNAALVIVSRLRETFPSFDAAMTPTLEGQPKNRKVVIEVLKTRVVDGGIAWLDDSVSPPAQEALTGLSFELGAVNSAQPDKRSPVTFVARLGDSGEVTVRGYLAPFSPEPSFALEGHIKGLDLSKVSAYTETVFAEKVQTGRVDAKFRAEAQAANMQGDASVRLTEISTLGGANRDGILSLQNSFNALKTKNQSVDFDVFFNFDLVRVASVGEALGREAKRTLNAMAKGQAPRMRQGIIAPVQPLAFEPLKYNTGEGELQAAQALRLKDIIAVAKENPAKHLSLCPISSGGEWAALYRQGKMLKSWEQIPSVQREHLIDLSRLRAKVLNGLLREAGLASSRYTLCDPSVDLSRDGPSVLMSTLQ